ncbi:hypothetical protein MsAg5_12680 [Methanosarcinaceae archaeon Ag5]|uniref:Uncharacterized protein n=1 Tax=Methanolapillus africanus TaxID=3028297 RepID=A0AAE4SDH8_9EURY|nr:hypothetical protein [Methanosarcinaceae archaeon Ag5]
MAFLKKIYFVLGIFCILLLFIISFGIYKSYMTESLVTFSGIIAFFAVFFFGMCIIKEKPKNWKPALIVDLIFLFIYMVIWFYLWKMNYFNQMDTNMIIVNMWINNILSLILGAIFVFSALYADKVIGKVQGKE